MPKSQSTRVRVAPYCGWRSVWAKRHEPPQRRPRIGAGGVCAGGDPGAAPCTHVFCRAGAPEKEARVLDEQWGQLQLEQGTWANPARVDTLARTRLGLIAPPHDRVRIETLTNAP
nr:cell division protein FtsL [Thiobacillus sp.]